MSSLTNSERIKLEKLFDMSGGYVIDFSNPSFKRFVYNSIKVDVDNVKYSTYGGSKANRLRSIWDIESDKNVGKLTEEMLQHLKTSKEIKNEIFDKKIFEDSSSTAFRLQGKKINKKSPRIRLTIS